MSVCLLKSDAGPSQFWLPILTAVIVSLCSGAQARSIPFGPPTTIADTLSTAEASSIAAYDIDGDGDLDFLGAGDQQDQGAWWENVNGDGLTLTRVTVDGSLDGASRARAADFDDDGDLDVIATAEDANEIRFYRNLLGDGSSWSETTVASGLSESYCVEPVDMDDDGDSNVRVAHGSTATYFVVVKIAVGAAGQSPNAFRIVHLTESTSAAEDAEADIPLTLAFSTNISAELEAKEVTAVRIWQGY
jgi:hypothetical protein